jgi:hypothetical protein
MRIFACTIIYEAEGERRTFRSLLARDDDREISEGFVEATLWHQIEGNFGSTVKLIDIILEEVEREG